MDDLLRLGVADMRATAMPARFDEAVEAARRRGEDTIRGVVAMRPEFVSWCERPASLDHNDPHPMNVFATGTRFYDWGDAVVAHPFGSPRAAFGLRVDGPEQRRPRDAYLEPFTDRTLPDDEPGELGRAPLATLLAVRAENWLAQGG